MHFQSLVPLLLAAMVLPAQAKEQPRVELKTPKERVSYASGVTTVRNFSKNNISFDLDRMIRGMRDAAEGKKLALDEKELTASLNGLEADLRSAQAATHQELANRNHTRGKEFLAEFKRKEGVKAFPNGVLYKMLKTGEGEKPVETDTVEVKYRGTTLDGAEFDATPPGKTASLRMNQTFLGWREALKQMPVGSRGQIVIPHLLAYGERGVGEVIGPNETLIFEVELVSIK